MHANVCVSLSERADGGNWKACVMQVPDVSVSEMSDRVAGGAEAKMQSCYSVNKAVDKERHMQCAKALVSRLERQNSYTNGPCFVLPLPS